MWADVLLGCFIDLDKVYSSFYALSTDYHSSKMISDFNISFSDGSNNSKPTKTIRMNGDWGTACMHTKWAILFAYPHCSNKLDEYEEYIIGQFARVEMSQHLRVLNLNRAIHLCESQSNHLPFMSFSSFSDLVTNHLISVKGTTQIKI